LRKFVVSLTYDFLLIARNSQARRKSDVSARCHKSRIRFFVNRAPGCQKQITEDPR